MCGGALRDVAPPALDLRLQRLRRLVASGDAALEVPLLGPAALPVRARGLDLFARRSTSRRTRSGIGREPLLLPARRCLLDAPLLQRPRPLLALFTQPLARRRRSRLLARLP